MPGPVIPFSPPKWADPKQASVFDSVWTRALRMIGRAIGANDPQSQVMGIAAPLEQPSTEAAAGMKFLEEKFPQLSQYIKAYHGSPHDFEQFSAEKIGTGEGAQAYSHGLYFAEHPAVAETYRNSLAGYPEIKNLKLGGLNVGQHNGLDYSPRGTSIYENVRSSLAEDVLLNQQALTGRPPNETQAYVLSRLDEKIKDYANEWPEALPDARRLRADLAKPNAISLTFGENPGKMYEVAIKAHPDQFLDWDKPLGQQGEQVNASINSAYRKLGGRVDVMPEHTGEAALRVLAQSPALKNLEYADQQIAISQALKNAGLPGVKYLDQVSRVGAGPNTRNYVVFDPKLIDIMKKYGIVATVAGGGTAAASQQPQGQQP